jgi:deoxycytidylate deaminase
MRAETELTTTPELVFGLVGPIGVNMSMVETRLSEALMGVGYTPIPIRVTALMSQIVVDVAVDDSLDPKRHYESRIEYANAVREKCKDDRALAALAILEIREQRRAINLVNSGELEGNDSDELDDLPLDAHAYIVRQLKRKEEVELLRKVYGRKFVQISVSVGAEDRIRTLSRQMASKNPNLDQRACDDAASELVERDQNESEVAHGQRVGDIFHLGDVFVDARTDVTAERTIRRFVEAFFGRNSVSPTRDEYGAYMAASASLRSLDTSRQVGAAIFSQKGEIVALGSNEVPKAGGGTYWSDEQHPHRDFDEGHDANATQKRRILFDIVEKLHSSGFIQAENVNSLFQRVSDSKAIDDALVMDITEFGRMTHAEMNAITDAARLGRGTADAVLFCTTFPCHNCAKHIVAAGIKRVVFIEPYPKSKALELHYDAICMNTPQDGKVLFEHFHGISPRRYRDIFEKSKRRAKNGTLQHWYEDDKPAPRVEDRGPHYVHNEPSAIAAPLVEVLKELGLAAD